MRSMDGLVLKTRSARSLSISSTCCKVCKCPKLKALRWKNSHNADLNIWPCYLSALRFGIFRRLAYARSSHNTVARPSPGLRCGADFPIFTPWFQTKWFLAVTAMIKRVGKTVKVKKDSAVIPTSALSLSSLLFSQTVCHVFRMHPPSMAAQMWQPVQCKSTPCLFSNPMWYSCFTCLHYNASY